MRIFKSFIAIILVCVICLSLCSCGISKEEAIGVWSGSYVYNGNQFSSGFVLSADGTYIQITYKNGNLNSAEEGTYEVKGGKVILHENGDMGISCEYKYKGGKLVNNGHEFYKD